MTSDIGRWLARYIEAWSSNDPAAIGELFADDAVYRPTPFSPGWRGREAIVAGWLDRKDDPGTWEFDHDTICASDDLAVIRGTTRYAAPYPTFSNLWLVRFDQNGRCREFTEWWMEKPQKGDYAASS